MKVLVALATIIAVASAAVIITPSGIIPPLEPRLELNETVDVFLNNSIATGRVTLSGAVILGLDTVSDNLSLNLISLVIKGQVAVVSVRVTGQYTADVQLHSETIGETHVVGSGSLDVTVEGITVDLNADFSLNIITQKLSLKKINVTPVITKVTLIAEGATADGEPIDNVAVGNDLPGVIANYFAKNQEKFNLEIVEFIDKVLGLHTLAEWLKILGITY